MSSSDVQKKLAVDLHSTQADEFAASYRDAPTGAYDTCFTYSRKRLNALLDRYLPARGNGERLLDVGCGTGHQMADLARRGYDVSGVDGSEEMLKHARENNPGRDIRQADVEALPYPDATFDYILSIEVLRYLPDYRQTVREMARVLKPGGVCLVTAAPRLNLNGYWLINRLAHKVPMGELVRLKQFFTSSDALRRAFGDAGFESPTIHGVYIGPVNWVEHASARALPGVLKAWEPIDAAIADTPITRNLANMYLVRAEKKGGGAGR